MGRAFALVRQGSRPLARMLLGLIWRRDHFVTGIVVVVGVALARYYALIARTHPWLWTVPPVLWCLTAAGLALQDQPDTPAEADQADDEEGVDEDEEDPPQDPEDDLDEELVDEPDQAPAPGVYEHQRTALLRWLKEITRERNGIHLAELYPAMRELPTLARYTDPQLRARLDHFQVPVTRSLTVDGISGKSGVRRADVQALLPSPDQDTPNTPRPHALGPSDLRKSRTERAGFSARSRRILGTLRAPRWARDRGLDDHIADALDVIR